MTDDGGWSYPRPAADAAARALAAASQTYVPVVRFVPVTCTGRGRHAAVKIGKVEVHADGSVSMATVRQKVAPWPSGSTVREGVPDATDGDPDDLLPSRISAPADDHAADHDGRQRWRLTCRCGRLDKPLTVDTVKAVLAALDGRADVWDASLTDDILRLAGHATRRTRPPAR